MSEAPRIVPEEYTFAPDATDAWRAHLDARGFCVLRGVVGSEEVAAAVDETWAWLEGLGSGIDRRDGATWNNDAWPGVLGPGLLLSHGGGHTAAAWRVRARPAVVAAFAVVWGTPDLITSMDTLIGWRDPRAAPPGEDWTARVEGVHCDQNPYHKRGLACVQGMVPLVDVDPRVGGLGVVPDTHTDAAQEALRMAYPLAAAHDDDWVLLNPGDPLAKAEQLVVCRAGDLILWDSRLLHGGVVGPESRAHGGGRTGRGGAYRGLVRLAATVTMTPRAWATPEVLEGRRRAAAEGRTLSHWPHEYRPHGLRATAGRRIPVREHVPRMLTPEEHRLL